MTINGKKIASKTVDDNHAMYSLREIKSSQFSRSFEIPNVASEEIDAELKNGILTIKIASNSVTPPPQAKKNSYKIIIHFREARYICWAF